VTRSNFEKKRILITGGQGLIGTYLSKKLLLKGYEVSILSRSAHNLQDISSYTWDTIEGNLHNFDAIVHLAGASIAARWTAKNKRIIAESRIKTCELLYKLVNQLDQKPHTFISASAVGFYGAQTSDRVMTESNEPGIDFLGTVCNEWEIATNKFKDLGLRTVSLRTGVVLSENGDAMRKLGGSIKFGLGAAFGTGKQYFPWIHIEDLCAMYIQAIEDSKMQGAYNAVAPEFITNKEFVAAFSKVLKKPYWLPNIPSFMLRSLLGEMSILLLEGSKISTEKIEAAGFTFKYPQVEEALADLLLKNR
jgi:uncharacterized protein (TIGR01777 family)